jgi:hypothetical protein
LVLLSTFCIFAQQKQEPMKKIVLLVFASVLFAACQESLEKRTERAMKEFTEKNCPMQITETIVLDSSVFEIANHNIHYYYRFVGALDKDTVFDNSLLRDALIASLKNDASTRIYKDAGYNFQYTYRLNSNREKIAFETQITKEEYK